MMETADRRASGVVQKLRINNRVEIAYTVHGTVDRPCLLAITGLAEGAAMWPTALVDSVVRAGYAFVAFDNRDVGASTRLQDVVPNMPEVRKALAAGVRPEAPYLLHDLADDTVSLIDGLGIGPVHLLGYSMGGYIGQSLAARFPDRTRSFIAAMTSTREPDLPPVPDHVRQATVGFSEHTDINTTIQRMTDFGALTSGSRYPTSVAERRAFAEAVVEAGFEPDSVGRQVLAILATPPFGDDVGGIAVPTTVIQGSDDCFFTVDHGEDLARRIPGGSPQDHRRGRTLSLQQPRAGFQPPRTRASRVGRAPSDERSQLLAHGAQG